MKSFYVHDSSKFIIFLLYLPTQETNEVRQGQDSYYVNKKNYKINFM